MSTSDHADDTTETLDFTVVDAPEETPEDGCCNGPCDNSCGGYGHMLANTTYIVHRLADGTEKRMPTSEWAAYAKENDL